MSRRPAKITQADVARVVRAAKLVGAERVEVRADGTLFIHLTTSSTEPTGAALETGKEIVL